MLKIAAIFALITIGGALDLMLSHGDKPDAPAWTFWCKLALELARATRRGNSLIGVALALRLMSTHGGRRASTDLLARFRDQLVLA